MHAWMVVEQGTTENSTWMLRVYVVVLSCVNVWRVASV